MTQDIKDKVVVITGASSGLGEAAARHLSRHGAKRVLGANVSSVAGHKVAPGGIVYSATKHAVRVISEGLRQEVKPYNIRTTVIRQVRSRRNCPRALPTPTSRREYARFTRSPFPPTPSPRWWYSR